MKCSYPHTHGKSRTSEHSIWMQMRSRCSNPKSRNYDTYGGSGVKVCERWSKSFAAFLEDVGPGPSPDHTLDRYPNKYGNYEPGNVRWATHLEQVRNARSNVMIEHDGKVLCVSEWAELSGVNYHTLMNRINRGMSISEALVPVDREDTDFRSGDKCPECGHVLRVIQTSRRGQLRMSYVACNTRFGGCGFRAGSYKTTVSRSEVRQ